jgi:plasmid maintenance system antidote protein VapI
MTLVQELLKQSKNGKKELARQDLIVSVTEQVWAILEDSNLSKADLARALETSKSNVTQLLSGNRNMTLATLADIGEALGAKPKVHFDRQGFIQQGRTGLTPQATTSSQSRGVFNLEAANQLQGTQTITARTHGFAKSAMSVGLPFLITTE